jgi:dihydrofolate reductase
MARRLRYQVAVSLDGFIAGPNGEYDWIPVDPGFDFGALFATFSHFLMGRRTWEALQLLGEADPTRGKEITVVSTTLHAPSRPHVRVVRRVDPEEIRALKASAERDVWLFGGAALFRTCLDAGLVDRIEATVVPVLLGGGVRVIPDGAMHRLKLLETNSIPGGSVQLIFAPT